MTEVADIPPRNESGSFSMTMLKDGNGLNCPSALNLQDSDEI